jgi:hypothetical protein
MVLRDFETFGTRYLPFQIVSMTVKSTDDFLVTQCRAVELLSKIHRSCARIPWSNRSGHTSGMVE